MTAQALIISNPNDEHTRVVCQKLSDLGVAPVMFFPEALGSGTSYSLMLPERERIHRHVFANESVEMDLSSFVSIWYRRPRLPALDRYAMTSEGIAFARDEWEATVQAAYALMRGQLWVSHPDLLRKAARKPLQLILAAQLGLTTPRTLITNSPEEARGFIEECREVIVKPTGPGWIYSADGSAVSYVLTNRIDLSSPEQLDEIGIAPVTLQEEVPKAYEVRANVVGQEVHAIRIESQRSSISRLDWRRYDVANTPYLPYRLPPQIEEACLELTRRLGLEFGAIDLIRRPDGEYVFLEINGNGQFLWAEELSGVKVSDALARLLAGVAPPLTRSP